MQLINLTAIPSTIPPPLREATNREARPGPSAIANLVLPAAERSRPPIVHGGDDPAGSFVARVADMCREQPLSQVLAYIDSGIAHGPAVAADALQAIITSLPEGYAWKQLRRDCANHPVPMHQDPLLLDNPAPLLEQAAALRALQQQISRAGEQGQGRDGMAGFAARAQTQLPLIADAEERSDYRALRDEINGLMQWTSRAIGEVSYALADDAPICCHDLWARYNLGQGNHTAGEARNRIWTMLISGKHNRFAHANCPQDPATFDGPLTRALRGGEAADAVCERFHVTHPGLRAWVQDVAPLLAGGQRLGAAHRLPFHAGI